MTQPKFRLRSTIDAREQLGRAVDERIRAYARAADTSYRITTVSYGIGATSLPADEDPDSTEPMVSHKLLSTAHSDTTPADVQRGDMVVGVGATPKWERKAKGNSGDVWTMVDANDPGWQAPTGGSFTLAGTTGTQTIANGDTLTLAAGDGVDGIAVTATDTATFTTCWTHSGDEIHPREANHYVKVQIGTPVVTAPTAGAVRIHAETYGLWAKTDSQIAVYGQSTDAIGVSGVSTNTHGVYGDGSTDNDKYSLYATRNTRVGLWGDWTPQVSVANPPSGGVRHWHDSAGRSYSQTSAGVIHDNSVGQRQTWRVLKRSSIWSDGATTVVQSPGCQIISENANRATTTSVTFTQTTSHDFSSHYVSTNYTDILWPVFYDKGAWISASNTVLFDSFDSLGGKVELRVRMKRSANYSDSYPAIGSCYLGINAEGVDTEIKESKTLTTSWAEYTLTADVSSLADQLEWFIEFIPSTDTAKGGKNPAFHIYIDEITVTQWKG